MDERNEEFEKPSKAQKKREMSELLSTVKELELLSLKELETSLDQELKLKILELQKITKGSAKKRQRQHIAKFLSKQDKAFSSEDLAKLKTSKMSENRKFREIETLREKLLINQEGIFESMKDSYPGIDMKRIKVLINLTQQEDKNGNRAHYRELFKVLRQGQGSVL